MSYPRIRAQPWSGDTAGKGQTYSIPYVPNLRPHEQATYPFQGKAKTREASTTLATPSLDIPRESTSKLDAMDKGTISRPEDDGLKDSGSREISVLSSQAEPVFARSPLAGRHLLRARGPEAHSMNIISYEEAFENERSSAAVSMERGSESEDKSFSSICIRPTEYGINAASGDGDGPPSRGHAELRPSIKEIEDRPEDVANVIEAQNGKSKGLQQASIDENEAQPKPVKEVHIALDTTEDRSPQPSIVTEIFKENGEGAPRHTSRSPSEEDSCEALRDRIVISTRAREDLGSEETSESTANLATHLASDTAVLHAYLNRKHANKIGNLQTDSIARRTSLEHRRDSGAIRQALASPRAVLEDKDINSPVLSKTDNVNPESTNAVTSLINISESAGLATDDLLKKDQEETRPARRSTRRRSRITPPAAGKTVVQPTNIAVRSGADSVVLKRTDAQEMAIVTRVNTRKNKGGALQPRSRLAKLVAIGPVEERIVETSEETQDGQRSIGWADPLVRGMLSPMRGGSEEPAGAQQQDNPDQPPEPRTKRLRGPRNGTPAKGMLTKAHLSPEIEPSTTTSMKGPGDVRPSEPPSPKKLKSTVRANGKENSLATPKKSGIPVGARQPATRTSGRKRIGGARVQGQAEMGM